MMNQKVKLLVSSVSVAALSLSMTVGAFAHGADLDFINRLTGANSRNNNDTMIRRLITRVLTERNLVINRVDGEVNTGLNSANDNTDGSGVKTGDADFGGTLVNETSSALWPIIDLSHHLGVGGGNKVTGFQSDNRNEVEVDVVTVVDIMSNTLFGNDIDGEANSGGNEANRNTIGGKVDTGDFRGDITLVNKAHHGGTGLIQITTGDLHVDFENQTTGAQSSNLNSLDLDKLVTVDVDEMTQVNNDVRTEANTGLNAANDNTRGGDVRTGDIDSRVDVENHTGTIAPVVVNTGSTAHIDAGNDTTGFQSDNRNEVSIRDTVVVDVQRTTNITNDLDLRANSGGNEANRNTIGGKVDTGDVRFDFNVMNR
jgi:hypothetical protein